jgi:hypothetical protein
MIIGSGGSTGTSVSSQNSSSKKVSPSGQTNNPLAVHSGVKFLKGMQNTVGSALGAAGSVQKSKPQKSQSSGILGDIGSFFGGVYHTVTHTGEQWTKDGVQWGKDAAHFAGSVVSKNPAGAAVGGLIGGPLGIFLGASAEGAVHQFSSYAHSDSHLSIQTHSSGASIGGKTAGLRAQDSANALLNQFSLKPSGMYSDTPTSGKPTSVWAESQAVNALIDTGHLNKAQQALNRLQSTYGQGNGMDPNPNVGFPQNRFYDDNSWVGQDYMQLYQKNHNPKDLQQAEKIKSVHRPGEQTTKPPDGNGACYLPMKGGMQWEENQSPQLNGTATGAAAELGAQLYQATGNAKYKNFAEQNLNFMNQHLSDSSHPGLYDNSLNLSSQKGSSSQKQIQIYNKSTHQWQTFSYSQNKSLYTYNQGTAIGAGVSLYQSTHNPKYLADAILTAQASQNYFNDVPNALSKSSQTLLMHDPSISHSSVESAASETRFWKEPPSFNAIYFRNLQGLNQELAQVSKNPKESQQLQEYLKSSTIPGNSNRTYAQQLQEYSGQNISSPGGVRNYAANLNNNSRQSLQNYLNRAWSQSRDPKTGLFTGGGIGHYGSETGTLLDQSGMVQMYSLLSTWHS